MGVVAFVLGGFFLGVYGSVAGRGGGGGGGVFFRFFCAFIRMAGIVRG